MSRPKNAAGAHRDTRRLGATLSDTVTAVLLATQLGLAQPARAEAFNCVIEPSLVVQVSGPVPGLLEAVLVGRGDKVAQGQVIARLSSRVEEATVLLLSEQATSTAAIEAQKARSTLAANRTAREQQLVKSKVTSEDRLEETIAQMEVAKQEVAMAEMRQRIAVLELRRAKEVLEQRKIRSPIDGIVVARNLFNGEYLDQDGKVATIAQLDPLNVEVFLPVKFFGKIRPGMTASITPNAPLKGTYAGTVSIVDQVFDAPSGTFGVRIDLRNPDYKLPAGHRCSVGFGNMGN